MLILVQKVKELISEDKFHQLLPKKSLLSAWVQETAKKIMASFAKKDNPALILQTAQK